jgi:hypothetical protein
VPLAEDAEYAGKYPPFAQMGSLLWQSEWWDFAGIDGDYISWLYVKTRLLGRGIRRKLRGWLSPKLALPPIPLF